MNVRINNNIQKSFAALHWRHNKQMSVEGYSLRRGVGKEIKQMNVRKRLIRSYSKSRLSYVLVSLVLIHNVAGPNTVIDCRATQAEHMRQIEAPSALH